MYIEKIHAMLAQYNLTMDQLSQKTKRKIDDLKKTENIKLPTARNADGTFTPKMQQKIDDLFDDIQTEVLDVYEDVLEKQTPPEPAPEPTPEPQPEPEKPKSFLSSWFGV